MTVKHLPLTQKVVLFTTLGLLGGMLCSWPLWCAATRTSFPLLPVLGTAYLEAGGWSWCSAVVLLLLLTVVLVFSAKKRPITVLLAYLMLLCCLDVNRLQPWVWMYGLVLATVLFGRSAGETRATLCWLLAAVYAWSGWHKLTPYFAEENFAWFCSAFSFTQPLAPYPALGYAVALLEMSLAFGLLWPRTRPIFRWLALAFHGGIVLLISPLGLNWNTVVIPWNITLAVLVWLVFAGADDTFFPKSNAHRLLLLLAGMAPLFHFVGAWPEAMSWKLYSNTQPEATFYAPARSFEQTVAQDIWQKKAFDHGTKLLLDDWANAELRTPMFATEHSFRQTALYLCGCLPQSDSAGLYILTVRPWNRRAEQWQTIPCRELLNIRR